MKFVLNFAHWILAKPVVLITSHHSYYRILPILSVFPFVIFLTNLYQLALCLLIGYQVMLFLFTNANVYVKHNPCDYWPISLTSVLIKA